MNTLRILLAHASAKSFIVHAADVEGAYLNADMDVELCIKTSSGLRLDNSKNNCHRLHKALYGLI